MNTLLVIIESRIGFAISLKQALEQTGHFKVIPLSDAFAALDFIAENPVQVVLVDLHMPEYPGAALIQAIQQKRPDALIYASTADSQLAIQATALNVTGLLDGNYTARQVLENLNRALPELTTDDQPTIEPPSRMPPLPDDNLETDALFRKLAAEEPPRPDAKHGGTITNFMRRVSDSELNNLLNSLSDVIDIPDEPVSTDDEDSEITTTESDTPAQYILEDITEETMPFESSPFESYLEQLRSSFENPVDPEPDFLEGETFEQDDELIRTTQPSASELERIQENRQNPETVTIHGEPVHDTPDEPATSKKDEGQLQEPAIPEEQETEAAPASPTPPEDSPELEQPEKPDADIWDWGDEDIGAMPEDPRIAQMAIRLTRTSLESTANATLLIENGEVVASDGDLADEDIAAVLDVVLESADTIKDSGGRVRFIVLPANGLDAMVYSRRTTGDDYIITMVFPGDTTVTNMRVQAKRLAEALESVPALPPEDVAELPESTQESEADEQPSKGGLRLEVPPPVDVGPLTRYTFVWLPRDPAFQIEHPVAEAINSGLRIQLGERGWAIEELDVEEDYVYLVAGIPGDEPPQSIARNLQKRSAKIAKIQSDVLNPESLWADSYFALAPGRKLEYQEIQQYINFCRM